MKSGEARRIRGLLVGPFPPPIGGDTVLTNNLWKSRYWPAHGILLDRVDTSPRGGVRLPEERLTVSDLLRGARIFAQFLGKLRGADFVLLWSNSRFIVTLGFPVMVACEASRKPVFVKSFGAFLGQRIHSLPAIRRAAMLSILARSASVLPETERVERELVGLGLPRGRVLALPNFLPDSAFLGSLPERRFSGRCVFVGQVKREKGVFDVIDALQGRPGLSCDFYGPLVDRDREAILSAVSRAGNASYRGVLAPEKVRDVIRSYDVLLLPTYHQGEGYPAVILESFAAGVPVVASRWLSLPELVEDGVRGLLVPPQAPEKIREALDRLSRDAALYGSLRRNAFSYVQSFSERKVVEGILIARVSDALARGGRR